MRLAALLVAAGCALTMGGCYDDYYVGYTTPTGAYVVAPADVSYSPYYYYNGGIVYNVNGLYYYHHGPRWYRYSYPPYYYGAHPHYYYPRYYRPHYYHYH